MTEQLALDGSSTCAYCGPLAFHRRNDTYLHKCACPHRTDDFCQAHPDGCDTFTDIRTRAYRATHHSSVKQLVELPGTTFEDIFVCGIDESAGLREDAA